jgi:photosystem II stability/assembly factor-like uncharacterized protein
MFQRQNRTAFPTRNIILLAIAVLGFLVFFIGKMREPSTAEQPPIEPETEEKRSSGLTPEESFYAMRDYPLFRPNVQTYTEALEQARLTDAAARPRGGNEGVLAPWTTQGPGNIGARINTMAVDPIDHQTIYLGYSGGGAWKTTNGGLTWNPIFDDHNFLSIGHIAIDPANPNILYLGTGDPNISGYPFIGDGIWKSTDKGETWEPYGLESTRIVSKIIVNPGGSNQLYAATMGLPFERNNDRGLYKSGTTAPNWQPSLFISNEAGIIDLVVSPNDPNTLYAAAWDRIRNNQESLISGNNARIWKSVNGGATWNKLSGGLPQGNQCRIGLCIDPNNGQHLFASYVGENLTFSGLYESSDGGNSWQLNAGNGLNSDFQSNFAWYFGQIRINPYNNQDIWLLGVTSFRSLNGGQNWYEAAGWQQGIHADHHDIAFLSAETFLLATDGGLYRTDDDANNWYRAENIPTTQFYRVAYNPHNPTFYYGGAQDNGTVAGNASTIDDWQRLYGGDGFQALFHPSNPNIFYFEYQNGAIGGTLDGGNFDDATVGIDDSDRRHWDMQYILSHHNTDILYTGTYRLYKGLGHLPSWSAITDDLTDGNIFGARFHTISTLDESPLDPDQVYVGTTDGNVWRVDPTNLTSTNLNAGLPDRYVSAVKASPSDPNRVFVAHTGYRDNDFSSRIHRSDDRGASWMPIAGDLPNLAINDLQILAGHQDSVLFAATDGGVYVTLNSGQHWERLGTGMPFVPVYDLDMNLAKRTLLAGTHARSIMSFPLDSLRIGENSSTFTPGGIAAPSLTVTPSPAYSSTEITVENLKSNQETEVFITDLSGKVCWRRAFKGFGKHTTALDLQPFNAGVYIAYAKSNGKLWATRKFMVCKT